MFTEEYQILVIKVFYVLYFVDYEKENIALDYYFTTGFLGYTNRAYFSGRLVATSLFYRCHFIIWIQNENNAVFKYYNTHDTHSKDISYKVEIKIFDEIQERRNENLAFRH